MSQPAQLFHIRCSREDLREAQTKPYVFERCLAVYQPEDGIFHTKSGDKVQVDEERRRITFSNGGSLPLDDPGSSGGMYTLSRETAYVFFRGLANGFRDGYNAYHAEVVDRMPPKLISVT